MQKVIKNMFSKRTLPVLILFLCAGLIVAFNTFGWGGNPPGKYEKILHNVGDMLKEVHYSPKKFDDEFSKSLFKKFLTDNFVDENKLILLQSDIQQLKKMETKLDDEILGATVQFVPAVSDIMHKRVPEATQLYKDILSKPFDFTKDEMFIGNPDQVDYPKSEAERRDNWRKFTKFLVLERYADLLENREKNKGTQGFVVKTDEELEKEARERVLKLLDRRYDRLMLPKSDEDRFNNYINTITEMMDPHSNFFPPVDKRSFDERMSGKFYGIGASLTEDEGNIKIGSLLTGSPAWKSGQVQVGDIILKVGQGSAEPVDLAGFLTEDAVKIIRGSKGSEVRLTLKKADGSVKVVSIIRDEIVQDEAYARSAVINTAKGKLGFIYLPDFYADFENPNGRRCSEDVRKEIIKLKAQKVDGIVMDLRNNGGGALYDVVQIVGLFIEDGPIVQVKDRDGKPQVYYDRDKSVLYDGPLAVMVNEFSASASEIFAAAIQDYNRGVIIGSTSTYGKGTVQRNIGLDKLVGFIDPNSDLGTIKLTLQKYYRINGGSVQRKGVMSDISLPDIYEFSKFREKDNPDALPYDEIKKADYNNWKYSLDLEPIKRASNDRMKASNAFTTIHKNTEWISKQNDKNVPLSLKKYQEEQRQIKASVKQIEASAKLAQEIDVAAVPDDLKKYENDTTKLDRFKDWIKRLRTDIYLDEAVNVVNDMVVQKNIVYNSNTSSARN
jgi:carboxyl-terminal processing protease